MSKLSVFKDDLVKGVEDLRQKLDQSAANHNHLLGRFQQAAELLKSVEEMLLLGKECISDIHSAVNAEAEVVAQ